MILRKKFRKKYEIIKNFLVFFVFLLICFCIFKDLFLLEVSYMPFPFGALAGSGRGWILFVKGVLVIHSPER